jgi:peptidyl-prolyl cis-trans isomerase D
MLKQLSRLERTRNLVIVAFAIIMAGSLVLFYAPGRNSANVAPAVSPEVLAKVSGDEITVGDLVTRKENLQQNLLQRFGSQLSLAQLGYTDKRFLDELINERVVAQEAARLGLAASDAEVADAIRKEFRDPSSGQFMGLDRYKEIVAANYGGVQQYEKQVRDSIAAEKLRAFITAGVSVSDEEVQDDYKRQNTTFDLVYVPVTADALAQKIQISDEDLRAYYNDHKTDYRIPEPQKKVRYLFINQAKVGEKLQIPDADLRAEYDKLPDENKQAGVRVQQIVLKIARPDLEQQVKAKADDLVAKARGASGSASEEAFAELAKGNSEDPATAKNGGQLPGLVKPNPNNPTDPLQSTLDMQPGQISDPIKYKNAYYIFRRGESVPKSFEDARAELLVSLRNRRAYAAASHLAARAAERLKETKDVQRVAQEFAAEANMTPTEMVRETPYIKPGDDVPNIGSSQQFEQAIAPLNNAGDVGERTGVKDGFAIPLLVDKKEPRLPDFDEVKDRVAQDVRRERAKAQLDEAARDIASNANSASDLKTIAEKYGLKVETANNYKLGAPLGHIEDSPALDEAIYNLQTGQVDKTPIKVGDNWVVVGATKRTEADLAEFAKERDELKERALEQRRNQIFGDYIAATRASMEREGRVKVYSDVLARLSEDEAPQAVPRNLPIQPRNTR